jgi:hypothetical protein
VSIHTTFSCVPSKAVLQFVVVLIGIRIILTVSLIQILVVLLLLLLLLIVTIVFIVVVAAIPKARATLGLLALYHQLYINCTLHNIVKIMRRINNLISILLIILAFFWNIPPSPGLYTYKVSDGYLKKQSHLINMVKENRVGYTQRQFEQAKRAQELYHIVGTPTIELFKTFIKMNAIKNCPVTTEDVNNTKKIFGADMLSLRGKSTRRKSTLVREDIIEIPEELISQSRKIDLCIDIMYVNKCGFMTTID